MTEFTEIQGYSWVIDVCIISVLVVIMLLIIPRISWGAPVRPLGYKARAIAILSPMQRKISIIIYGCSIILIVSYFLSRHLYIHVDETGIHYRMFPLQWKERDIKWEDVDYVAMTRFSTSYYTQRRSYTNYQNLFYISGNQGLYVKLTDGTAIVLGTQKPAKLRQVLNNMIQAEIIRSRQYYQ